jgi:nucleoside phosphorylase
MISASSFQLLSSFTKPEGQSAIDHIAEILQKLQELLQADIYFELGDDQQTIDCILSMLQGLGRLLERDVQAQYGLGSGRSLKQVKFYSKLVDDLLRATEFLENTKYEGSGSRNKTRQLERLLDLCLADLEALVNGSGIKPKAGAPKTGAGSQVPKEVTRSPRLIGAPVDIGIVIALREEFEVFHDEIDGACRSDRDDKTGNYYFLFDRPTADNKRQYRCIATFCGDMGPQKSGLTTQSLIHKYEPNTLVMLGIAASLDEDVDVGDVVVANQIDAYLENSKAVATQGGFRLQCGGEAYRSSEELIKFAWNFAFAHKRAFQKWKERCSGEFHLCFGQSLDKVSAGRKRLSGDVNFYIGHIASGPTVGAAKTFVEWLKERDRKYLALEMEAAGLMAAVYNRVDLPRTLVLRAISDYGDERKKELDLVGEGAFRRYAMHNTIQLLWSFMEVAAFPGASRRVPGW